MKRTLLLFLGWATIGTLNGMWYARGGVRPEKLKDVARLQGFAKQLVRQSGEIIYELAKYENELLQKRIEHQNFIAAQPIDTIKIKLNNTDIPDCHFPNQIVQTHTRDVESISEFVMCSTANRVQMLATSRGNIKITLNTCANDLMCAEYFIRKASIKKLDHQLFIVPPQLDHKYTSCFIEHPMEKEFKLESISSEEFMSRFGSEPVIESSRSSSSSDFYLSDDEE